MTPQELISTLKQLHEAATPEPWHTDKNRHPTTDGLPWGWLAWKRHEAGGSPTNIPGLTCHWEGKQGRANAELLERLRNELPRIIRLLEAGEMVVSAIQEVSVWRGRLENHEEACERCSESFVGDYNDCSRREKVNDILAERHERLAAALSAYEEAGK